MRTIGIIAFAGAVALALAACEDEGGLAGPKPPSGALRFTDLDVGYLHACGVTTRGDVYCWGSNLTGALGTGAIGSSLVPARVAGQRRWIDVDAGGGHTCALDEDGHAWCWGFNDEGQLGDGTQTTRGAPVAVQGGRSFVAIATGHDHACGLTASGQAWCWGDDLEGQLGDGPSEASFSTTPVQVQLAGTMRAIAAGFDHTCALLDDGSAWCWGTNYMGQNGDSTFVARDAPVPVEGGHAFESIATGDGFACGVSDGELLCWGSNRFFELARAPADTALVPAAVPVGEVRRVSPAVGAESLGGARPYACAIRDDRRAICWGGEIAQLRAAGPEPTLLDADIRFGRIAAGPTWLCGLRVDGYAYCAGAGSAGQLGNGETEGRAAMTPVAAPEE